jgi:hypothetical protein
VLNLFATFWSLEPFFHSNKEMSIGTKVLVALGSFVLLQGLLALLNLLFHYLFGAAITGKARRRNVFTRIVLFYRGSAVSLRHDHHPDFRGASHCFEGLEGLLQHCKESIYNSPRVDSFRGLTHIF